jgi:hypothetical protein
MDETKPAKDYTVKLHSNPQAIVIYLYWPT